MRRFIEILSTHQRKDGGVNVTFLGTGTSGGVPMIGCDCSVCQSTDSKDQRLRSSIFIQVDKQHLLIDCGPDFRQQLLRHQINDVDAVLLTHEHFDHIGGFDDIRALNYVHQKPMDFYCEHSVSEAIRSLFYYVFNQPHKRSYEGSVSPN